MPYLSRISYIAIGLTVIWMWDVGKYLVLATSHDVVKMRVIVDPVSLSQANHAAAAVREDEDEEADNGEPITVRVEPASFSGPEHFRSLDGQCFQFDDEKFEYKLCPFQNATQKENNGRRRTTSIGVWHDWIVKNESFAGWRFLNGKPCDAETVRQTIVDFECGSVPLIWEVAEPARCHYHLTFKLPQACYTDPLLVYPILPQELRTRWDMLEKEYLDGEITDKGYDVRLSEILGDANLVRLEAALAAPTTDPSSQFTTLRNVATSGVVSEAVSSVNDGPSGGSRFQSVDQCQKEFRDLEEKYRRLKEFCPAAGQVLG
ncbi:hypothetical protein RvY_14320 [Ramazzottius varieornatus]|uniref:MRH domain-containing protein n=1 Tax=Ramazzottius varieornatus TaxID=947166 RepID=A0A1D1VQV7_RAMVA|nr:hypothetical protein RvY_14320 [Ramazzottius varieornatus]